MSKPRVAVICFWYGNWPESRPELGAIYVQKLYHSVRANSTVPLDFLIFTDGIKYQDKELLKGYPVYPMTKEFERFRWNLKKMYMFTKDAALSQYDWVVCLDLDLVITGDITFLLNHRSEHLITCQGAYTKQAGGSIVGFHPGESWQENLVTFLRNYYDIVESETKGSERKFYRWLCSDGHNGSGSGIFGEIEYWQDLYPGKVLSYKVDGYRNGARIIRFHGSPRPHEVKEQWLREYWI